MIVTGQVTVINTRYETEIPEKRGKCFCGRVAQVPKVYPHCIFTELLLCALALVGMRGGSTR